MDARVTAAGVDDAAALAQQIRAGKTSAREVLEQHLDRIDTFNESLNALISVDRDAARRAADSADVALREGRAHGVLHGVPVSFKDSFETAGLRTTASYAPLAAHVPQRDATVVARLRAAGAVVIGKTNLPELATEVECDSPLHGPTRNPWDARLTPGGSSGGSAVAVAAGMSALDVGSDLAGSLRVPAHYCGVYSLKPTDGRVSGAGHIPPLDGQVTSLRHLWSFGPLARSVDDLELAYGVLAGADDRDMNSAPMPVEAPIGEISKPRIAFNLDFDGVPLCDATRAALLDAVESLRGSGFEVVQAAPPAFAYPAAWRTYGGIIGAENTFSIPIPRRERLAALLLPPRWQRNNEMGRELVRARRLGLRRYMANHATRHELSVALESFLADWDAWLVPATSTPAREPTPGKLNKGHLVTDVAGQQVPYWVARISHTTVFSVTGNPVVTLPVSYANGVPIGAQLVGRRWQESQLLAVARALDSRLVGFRPPPLGPTG